MTTPRVLGLLGATGCLGRSIEHVFESHSWTVIRLPSRILSPDFATRCDAVVSAAGAFAGGMGTEDSRRMLWEANVETTYRAIEYGKRSRAGIVVVAGSRAAFEGNCDFAVAYGTTKVAAHFLVKMVWAGDRVVKCILPGTLDTPRNREEMPKADFKEWTAVEKVAMDVFELCENPSKGDSPFVFV